MFGLVCSGRVLSFLGVKYFLYIVICFSVFS